jgi:cytochrome o ubiquinol oxidase operon protein cyoD
MIDPHHGWNVSVKPPLIGFVLSFILVFASYLIVVNGHFSNFFLLAMLFSLAVVQALVQLVFFLHLGLESKPHWNVITFLFTVLVILIVLGGSLWIMDNLNYNLMMPMEH